MFICEHGLDIKVLLLLEITYVVALQGMFDILIIILDMQGALLTTTLKIKYEMTIFQE